MMTSIEVAAPSPRTTLRVPRTATSRLPTRRSVATISLMGDAYSSFIVATSSPGTSPPESRKAVSSAIPSEVVVPGITIGRSRAGGGRWPREVWWGR